MNSRMKKLGYVLAVIGLGFLVGAGIAFNIARDGNKSLQAFSEAQNVTLSYNDDGQLIDRGTTEGADAIMTLLTEDWGYPVVMSHPERVHVSDGHHWLPHVAWINRGHPRR